MLDYFINYFINLDFKITYPVTNILECISIVFVLTPFERSKKYAIRRVIDIFAVLFAYLLLGSFYYMIFGDAGHRFFMATVYSVIIVGYAAFRSELKLVVRVINGFFLLGTFILLVEISGSAGYLIEQAVGVDVIPVNILMNALILFADILLVNFKPFNEEENVSPLNVTVFLFIALVVLILQIIGINDLDKQVLRFVLFLSFWAIDILTYYLAYYLTHKQNANLALMAELRERKNAEDLMRVSEQNLRNIREFMHDEKNKFLTLRMLLEKGQIEEAKKFFDELEINLRAVDGGKPLIDCGNNLINAVINIENAKASSYGVLLDTSFMVPPRLAIEDNALCSLLMNLIDNAIEATVAAGSAEAVTMSVKLVNEALFIRVCNPVGDRKEERLLLKTTKDEKNLHGYGTKIIEKIVNKHSGAIEYKIDAEVFTADAMLQLRTEE